jgi:hypothetical protein
MNNFRIQLGSFLAFIALLIGLVSLPFSSEATFGTTVGAFACLLAILARIIQAGGQRQEEREWRDADRKTAA